MAGMRPFFLTGASAKIKVNNVTLAYCANLSYSITVNHATPKVLGMYEPTSVEPLSYLVTGSFTVIRYIADVKDRVGGSAPFGVNEAGNGIGKWGKQGLLQGFSTSEGKTYDNLNPSKMDKAIGFTIDIYQKLPGTTSTNSVLQSVAKIREARITKADFNIGKGSPATQTFQFTALYADEDSFLADFSGQGQQWE